MKLLTYTTVILFLFVSQTFAQKDQFINQYDLNNVETDIYPYQNDKPEGIEVIAALNDGDDIIIDFTTETPQETIYLNIFDVTGKLILSKDFIANNTKNRISVATSITSKGIYIISLNTKKDKSVKKFYL